MSGLEVVGAVAAVVSAFHGGAELVAHIKKKHRKRKSEQAMREKQLQESLQTGESQVDQRYSNDCRELGEYMRRGDTIARDRLLHITVCMQAEIIRSLQLAVKYENAILDLTVLLESSILNRRETITTLDELKQRIIIARPVERQLAPPPMEPNSRSSFESVQSFRTANLAPPTEGYLPPAIILPDPEEQETKSGLSRFLSSKRSNRGQGHRPTTSTSSMSYNPTYNYMGPGDQRNDMMRDINETLNSFQGLSIDGARRDTLAHLQGLPGQPPQSNNDLFNQPLFNPYNPSSHTLNQPRSAFNRNNSTSTHNSTHSDNVPPSIVSLSSRGSSSPTSSSVPSFSNRSSITGATSPSPIEPDPQPSGFNPGYRPVAPHQKPQSPTTATPRPTMYPRPNNHRTSTISMPSIASTQMMTGRPCKDNNYWGFCKGSWACREETKKGLSLQTRPEGLYSHVQIWQCKHCQFQGDSFSKIEPGKKKKEIVVDPNIHTSAVGIKYRWIFLAKSHVKKKTAPHAYTSRDADCNYGCIFCCAEGRGTSIFGNVETLMNHVFVEHAKGMSEKTMEVTRCIVGRPAAAAEIWDVNIPFSQILDDGSQVKELES